VRNYDYLFDANGNVVQEIFRTDGAINAHYEYDPFGNTVVATGVDATDNPFRFSTKWFDNNTRLGYWGYRWYSPGMGRWLSRDPFDEMGGVLHRIFSAALSSVLTMLDNALISLLAEDINPDDPLYVFVENSVLDLIDPQGLSSSCPFGCVNGRCPKPPPYAPEENGCGPGWATWISDAPVQGCSFLEACNKHDRCYGTCNAGKGRCDKEFKNDMLDACNRCSFNETTERVRIGRRGRGGGWRRRVVTEEAWRRRCRSTARLYASAVRMPIVSHASYTEGQNDGCENCSCEEGQQRDAWPPIDDDFDSPQPVPIIKIPW
jgi:RHS repeat-associated protein